MWGGGERGKGWRWEEIPGFLSLVPTPLSGLGSRGCTCWIRKGENPRLGWSWFLPFWWFQFTSGTNQTELSMTGPEELVEDLGQAWLTGSGTTCPGAGGVTVIWLGPPTTTSPCPCSISALLRDVEGWAGAWGFLGPILPSLPPAHKTTGSWGVWGRALNWTR